MDQKTLQVYAEKAATLCARYRGVQPTELHHTLLGFFHTGEATADIGCGSGRDVAWLNAEAFPVRGYDASPAMLQEARTAFPGIDVRSGTLPDLIEIPDGEFRNVLCSATLMHVRREDLITAVLNLARIVRPGGRLVVSYRGSASGAEREPDGRLFTPLPAGQLTLLLESAGLQVIQSLPQVDATRPAIQWSVILAEKNPLLVSRGLERVQSVLVQDRKDATYKYALIRALCGISRNEPHVVRWGRGSVFVPLWAIAVRWLQYYWELVAAPGFVAQKRGERPGSPKPIMFRQTLQELAAAHGPGGLFSILRDLDERPERYEQPLRVIATAIRTGPVQFSGTSGPRLFQYARTCPVPGPASLETGFGWVEVPEPTWMDICRFGHWIEDSLILRWAQLTAEMNPGRTTAEFIPLLLQEAASERDTAEVRAVLSTLDRPLECVWSGAPLHRTFEVDHVIPHSVWGNNDWWNLLPAQPRLNHQKSDALPSRSLLLERKGCIIGYWQEYYGRVPVRFGRQVQRALGIPVGHTGWERLAFAGLQETVERLVMTRGLERWPRPG